MQRYHGTKIQLDRKCKEVIVVHGGPNANILLRWLTAPMMPCLCWAYHMQGGKFSGTTMDISVVK